MEFGNWKKGIVSTEAHIQESYDHICKTSLHNSSLIHSSQRSMYSSQEKVKDIKNPVAQVAFETVSAILNCKMTYWLEQNPTVLTPVHTDDITFDKFL